MIKTSKDLGKELSFWIASTPDTNYPVLSHDIKTDVCVIGAGIAGITVATLLKEAGLKVTLIDSFKIVKDVTGYTTAKVTSQHENIYQYLIEKFGWEKAKMYADAQEAGLSLLKNWVREKNIHCDFVSESAYTIAQDDESLKLVEKETDVAKKLGLPASFVSKIDLPLKIKGAVRFKNQARFHPRKYLLSLADNLVKDGSFIFEKTRALDIQDGNPCIVLADKRKIIAKKVVIATNFPFLKNSGYQERMYAKRSYVILMSLKNRIPKGIYISTKKPFHSFRPVDTKDESLFLIGGEDHEASEAVSEQEKYEKLAKYAFSNFNVGEVKYHWNTQDYVTEDRIPYIGKFKKDSKNVFVITGFGGWGMTNSHAAALIIRDLILEKKNPWQEVFDPERIEQKSKKITIQKKTDTVGLSQKDFDSIQNNSGKVFVKGDQKIAVYKNEKGEIFVISPICTHKGCTVGWNDKAKTWDCPCHGSRYDPLGKVIHGPAQKSLTKLN